MSKASTIRTWSFAVSVFICLLTTSYIHASSPIPEEVSADQKSKIFEKIRTLQKDIHSIHASVSQEKQLTVLKKKVHVEGTVTIAKPNMLRWDVVRPDKSITIIDGETMTVYHPDIKEAQIYTLSENFIARNTMSFFTSAMSGDLSEMQKKFSVAIFKNNSKIIFELVPLSKMTRQYLTAITIHYNEATGIPQEFEITTPKGDRTVTRLRDIEINPDLKIETFKMELPEDVWITNKQEQNTY
jgi:outer membrane lipoprotein-sorting protein